jgi:hypothetical protein
MTAFRRRTAFATPFIAILGCGGPQRPEEKRIPGETWSVFARDGACEASSIEQPCPKGALCNPPPPRQIECPAGITEPERVKVVQRPDATCAIVPDGCVELACATQPTACPLPFGAPRKFRAIWTVARHDADCRACKTEPCGEDARAIQCPPTLKPTPVRIGELPSGTCAVIPDACVDESCAGDALPCPMPRGEDLPPLVWDIARTANSCTATSRGPIAGERTINFECPQQTTWPPRFQIRRTDLAAPCEFFVGSGPGVPTKCPDAK